MSMHKGLMNRAHLATTMTTLAAASLLLTACADSVKAPLVEPRTTAVVPEISLPAAPPQSKYTDLTCVPYARMVSGINLRGDAYTWWNGAAGIYQRGAAPTPGAVLVLAQTNRLHSGHVAVVRQVVSPREILVDHANWIRGEISSAQAVYDASPNNDWTMPRFFNIEAGVYGRVYPAYGFIYNVAAGAAPAPVASSSSQDWVPPQ